MLEVAPPPPWLMNPHVFVFCLDQCNQWQAAKDSRRGHFRGAERLSSTGMPIHIRSETVVNVVQMNIPLTLGMLTQAEAQLVEKNGPYTEDYRNMLHPLEPACVREQLKQGMEELVELLVDLKDDSISQSFALPSEVDIAKKVLGRPPPPTGPTSLEFLPTIPDSDTKAFKDVFKFLPIIMMRCAMTMCCLIIYGDGQTVEILRACKFRWPSEYKHILIANGYFHAFTHFIFTLHEGYWKCCLCTFALWLHKVLAYS